MSRLFDNLKQSAMEWRRNGYTCDDYPLIGEILAYQTEHQADTTPLRFLRAPQFLALEVYWYVRLKLGTPHVIDLYTHYYGDDKAALFDALGAPVSRDALEIASTDQIIEKIRNDSDWVSRLNIQALHEAMILAYPSYILALAMGAGKTVLIGAIIATEFAMSLRYPEDQPVRFMKNAFVFAPGTTIIESLRELSGIPYEKILPPDLNRDVMANLKIEFPGSGKNIQAQRGSSYNLIVTNTEKISLRVNRRIHLQQEAFEREELQANLRLQTIASLPNLGIFSDEAHHTYGNTYDKLKRVRETINYINDHTPVVAVVNTTGTPYYKKQYLKDVIVWYGLGDGIRDNILKDLNDGVQIYNFSQQEEQEVFTDIIQWFFQTCGTVSLPDGARAKIAFYFKTQRHLDASRQLIEQAMTHVGESVSQILVNTQASSSTEVAEFKRLNNPDSQKRVILLIGKGVEGWNCPSLFSCALIKEQTTSNNYVLQAATRCLRQIPGNTHSAKIFLDSGNARIFNKELQDNFGTDLDRLSAGTRDKQTVTLRILKTDLPKLEIIRTVKRAVRAKATGGTLTLNKPAAQHAPGILRGIFTPDFSGPREILMPTGEMRALPAGKRVTGCHTAAWKIASRYHLPVLQVLKKLNVLYPKGELPDSHLYGLFQQVETQQANYTTIEETIKEVMALIRVQDENGEDLFEKDEHNRYVHRLRLLKRSYERMQDHGLFASRDNYDDAHDLSFHYDPYNFDSGPERALFRQVLSLLRTEPCDVEAFVFTGGLTDPNKTDFHFEYLGEDKRYHPYFPDFVIVKKTGEFCIVEVKATNEKGDSTVEAKRKAVERLQNIQPDRFAYHIVYSSAGTVEDISPVTAWIKGLT